MDHQLYQQAHQLINESNLGRVTEQLKHYLKLGIGIKSSSFFLHSLPPGDSKLGGFPDLPLTLTWPTWKSVPMVFLAQIALQDISLYDSGGVLPSSGFLSFFCQSQSLSQGVDTKVWDYIDPREPEGWKVHFFDEERTKLHRTQAPEGLPLQALLPECKLHLWPALMLPPLESLLIASLNLHGTEIKKYLALLEWFERVYP